MAVHHEEINSILEEAKAVRRQIAEANRSVLDFTLAFRPLDFSSKVTQEGVNVCIPSSIFELFSTQWLCYHIFKCVWCVVHSNPAFAKQQ